MAAEGADVTLRATQIPELQADETEDEVVPGGWLGMARRGMPDTDEMTSVDDAEEGDTIAICHRFGEQSDWSKVFALVHDMSCLGGRVFLFTAAGDPLDVDSAPLKVVGGACAFLLVKQVWGTLLRFPTSEDLGDALPPPASPAPEPPPAVSLKEGSRVLVAFGDEATWYGGVLGAELKGLMPLGLDDGDLQECKLETLADWAKDGFLQLQKFDPPGTDFQPMMHGVVKDLPGMRAACAFTTVKHGAGTEKVVGVLLARIPDQLYGTLSLYQAHHVCSARFHTQRTRRTSQAQAGNQDRGGFHTFVKGDLVGFKGAKDDIAVTGVVFAFIWKPKDAQDQGRKWIVVYLSKELAIANRFLLQPTTSWVRQQRLDVISEEDTDAPGFVAGCLSPDEMAQMDSDWILFGKFGSIKKLADAQNAAKTFPAVLVAARTEKKIEIKQAEADAAAAGRREAEAQAGEKARQLQVRINKGKARLAAQEEANGKAHLEGLEREADQLDKDIMAADARPMDVGTPAIMPPDAPVPPRVAAAAPAGALKTVVASAAAVAPAGKPAGTLAVFAPQPTALQAGTPEREVSLEYKISRLEGEQQRAAFRSKDDLDAQARAEEREGQIELAKFELARMRRKRGLFS